MLRQLCLENRYLTALSKIKTRTKAETTFRHQSATLPRSAEDNLTLVRRYHGEICFYSITSDVRFTSGSILIAALLWQHSSVNTSFHIQQNVCKIFLEFLKKFK